MELGIALWSCTPVMPHRRVPRRQPSAAPGHPQAEPGAIRRGHFSDQGPLAYRPDGRHLGTTPMAYLRKARMDCAHRDLLAASPPHDTVAAIAARWGFSNPGRLAAAHRAAFGHPPSHTLHR
ncbi:helix-turn-helix domain-containing protein [Amycolatopsis sp. NPDC089917]|uniref:helix-turn-helix domain-containing protein n=1 Tax=Amycolatopsis sp. NPDC089917 TaxID=3155187 RepID=UPI00343AAA3D